MYGAAWTNRLNIGFLWKQTYVKDDSDDLSCGEFAWKLRVENRPLIEYGSEACSHGMYNVNKLAHFMNVKKNVLRLEIEASDLDGPSFPDTQMTYDVCKGIMDLDLHSTSWSYGKIDFSIPCRAYGGPEVTGFFNARIKYGDAQTTVPNLSHLNWATTAPKPGKAPGGSPAMRPGGSPAAQSVIPDPPTIISPTNGQRLCGPVPLSIFSTYKANEYVNKILLVFERYNKNCGDQNNPVCWQQQNLQGFSEVDDIVQTQMQRSLFAPTNVGAWWRLKARSETKHVWHSDWSPWVQFRIKKTENCATLAPGMPIGHLKQR